MRKMMFAALTAALPFLASAMTDSPATGAEAPVMLPFFIGLMVIAVVAIIVCLLLFKKKK